MFFMETLGVSWDKRAEYNNRLCGQNVELFLLHQVSACTYLQVVTTLIYKG